MPRASRSVIRAIVRGALVVPLLGVVSPAGAASFTQRTVVTIDRNQVPGVASLVDFPVLVSVTSNNLRTTANGGFVTSDLGHDIIFQGEDAPTCAPAAPPCRLDHEIESYDGVNGTIVAWVRVPAIFGSLAGANTPIYMYYGDATITCSQENKNGVWDASYREVFHLNESGDHTDSTANAFTAVGKGAVTKGVAGKVGPAVDFGGGVLGTTPARLIVSDGKLTTTTSFTFEAWVYFRSYVPGGYVGFVTKGRECLNFDGSPVPQPGYCMAEPCGDWIALYKANADNVLAGLGVGWRTRGVQGRQHGRPRPRRQHRPVVPRRGHLRPGDEDPAPLRRRDPGGDRQRRRACLSADIPHYTLMGIDNLQDDYLDGILDEMRVSFAARGAAWIQTGYNNQNAPFVGAGGFYSSIAHQTGGPWTVGATTCPALEPLRRRARHLLPAVHRQHRRATRRAAARAPRPTARPW